MSAKTTYYAALPVTEDDARRVADQAGWSFDEKLSRIAPPNVQVIRIDQDVSDPRHLSHTGAELREQLVGLEQGPAAIAANVGGASGIGMDLGGNKLPQSRWEVNLLPTKLGPGVLSSIIAGTLPPSRSPSKDDVKGDGASGEKSNSAESKSDQTASKTATETAASSPAAAAITAAIPALADPSKLWRYLDGEERKAISKQTIEEIYADRSRLARRSEWIFAPEMALLESSPDGERAQLAEDLLRVRAQLTDPDEDLRKARADLRHKQAELAGKDVELAAKRVELAGVGVEMSREMVEQMKKWRSLAGWGLGGLVATTIFAMCAVGYVLMYLIPGGKIGDVAAPIVIFALALFAISPAVLLLRERPMEGLDKWSPGGGETGKGESQENDAAAEEGSDDSTSQKPPPGDAS